MTTYCFIDASNLRHSADNNYKVDYKKLATYLRSRLGVDKIFYFGALFVGDYYKEHDYTNSDYIDIDDLSIYLDSCNRLSASKYKSVRELAFIRKISGFGYRVFVKPLKIMHNGKRKADCDVNIAIEAMARISEFDTLILLSGDGDLLPLLRAMNNAGKDIRLASFSDNTARELRQFVGGSWINLSTMKHLLSVDV